MEAFAITFVFWNWKTQILKPLSFLLTPTLRLKISYFPQADKIRL